MSWEGKKYKLTSSKDFDVLLRAYGLSAENIQKVENSPEVLSVSKNGEGYSFTREIGGHVLDTKFKLGEEFDDKRVDGVSVKALITEEGSGFRYVRKSDDGRDNVSVLKFDGNTLVTETTLKGTDIVSIRNYTAV